MSRRFSRPRFVTLRPRFFGLFTGLLRAFVVVGFGIWIWYKRAVQLRAWVFQFTVFFQISYQTPHIQLRCHNLLFDLLVLLLAHRGGVFVLVLAQTVQHYVGSKIAVQLKTSLADVFKRRQYFFQLHCWEHLADVVHGVLQVRLRLKGARGVYVAYQALQLAQKQNLRFLAF